MQELRSEYCKVCRIKEGATYDVCAYCRVEEGIGPFGTFMLDSCKEVQEWMATKALQEQLNGVRGLIRLRIQHAAVELIDSLMDLELLAELDETHREQLESAVLLLDLACRSVVEVFQCLRNR